MKYIAAAWIALTIFAIGGLTGNVTASPGQPQRVICLQSHTQVVMIPTMCGKAKLGDVPIVAEVCERIESGAAPVSQEDDDDE